MKNSAAYFQRGRFAAEIRCRNQVGIDYPYIFATVRLLTTLVVHRRGRQTRCMVWQQGLDNSVPQDAE